MLERWWVSGAADGPDRLGDPGRFWAIGDREASGGLADGHSEFGCPGPMFGCVVDPIAAGVWSASPFPVFPELFVDLDLMLLGALAAGDEEARVVALATADVEFLWRLGHLNEPWVRCKDAAFTVNALERLVPRFEQAGEPQLGRWLLAVLTAWAQTWHDTFNASLMSVAQASTSGRACETVRAAVGAAEILRRSAAAFTAREFVSIPPRCTEGLRAELLFVAMDVFHTHVQRVPLRVLLDGAGGLAAAPEHNPLTAAVFDFDTAVYRRLYRVFYELIEHVGYFDDESNRDGHLTPEEVDRRVY